MSHISIGRDLQGFISNFLGTNLHLDIYVLFTLPFASRSSESGPFVCSLTTFARVFLQAGIYIAVCNSARLNCIRDGSCFSGQLKKVLDIKCISASGTNRKHTVAFA